MTSPAPASARDRASISTPEKSAPACPDCLPESGQETAGDEPLARTQRESSVAESSTSGVHGTEDIREAVQVKEDVMNPYTFQPMILEENPRPEIYIEYCDRCRWAPRATWVQTELFLTFPTPILHSITLLPTMEHAGRFRIWLKFSKLDWQRVPQQILPEHRREIRGGEGGGFVMVWDRKTEGGFPELKILKQRIRNIVQPGQSLGHSDKPAAGKTHASLMATD